ncbi:MAG: GGDEF domain-containing protein [Pseudomonadota bacterium]|nr:GGDEF domain-containing protein [Pseudomonadota bacterium]
MSLIRDEMGIVMDRLCPMHVILADDGRISRVGPTLQKLRPDVPMAGQMFLELFELNRPRAVNSMADLIERQGGKLHLRLRDVPRTALKGQIVKLPNTAGSVVNLSFGISVLDAVRDYELNAADFAATDLTIEMLYLVEAKSAAMEASRKLNMRLQGAMIAAEEQAYTDTLTGLKNRRAMDYLLDRLIQSGGRFALMNLDLDYFKQVNDSLGHAAGDHVLQRVARIMTEETRETDMIARVGGDEFVVIFNRLVDRDRLDRIATKMIARIREPVLFKGHTCQISVSIGTVLSPASGEVTAEKMMHQGDMALYAAKDSGRGAHFFYSPEMERRKSRARAASGPDRERRQPRG